jgi:hypothetical protein
LRYPSSGGSYAKVFDYIPGWLVDKFFEIYAIIALARQLAYKTGNLSGLDSLRGLPQKRFLTAMAKVAA